MFGIGYLFPFIFWSSIGSQTPSIKVESRCALRLTDDGSRAYLGADRTKPEDVATGMRL